MKIYKITNEFIELHGDRVAKDDKAMVGGIGEIDGNSVMLIGQQKGRTTKEIELAAMMAEIMEAENGSGQT